MFYENFELMCDRAKISPSAAGLAIGLSKSTPSAWKKNHTIPKEDELLALAKILNCNVSDFFRSGEERADTIHYALIDEEGIEDENITDFLMIYRNINN